MAKWVSEELVPLTHSQGGTCHIVGATGASKRATRRTLISLFN